jgi:DNA (cytosine-5)-methyltransferase 1
MAHTNINPLPKNQTMLGTLDTNKGYPTYGVNKPLPAIVNVLKNRIVRPDCSGYVSLEEIKRAQGFPKDYKMVGSLSSQAQQLANAVPVEMASAFAKAFFHSYHPNHSKLNYYFQQPIGEIR